jgi:hypothetical protein
VGANDAVARPNYDTIIFENPIYKKQMISLIRKHFPKSILKEKKLLLASFALTDVNYFAKNYASLQRFFAPQDKGTYLYVYCFQLPDASWQ